MPKISALPAGSTLNPTDQAAFNNGGTTRRFTVQQIATDHGMIAVANNTDLSNTAGTRARFVLVLNNGIFEYKTSGTPNGTTIFSALGGGVWEREMKHDDGSGGGGVSDGNKGDVTVSGSGTSWAVNAASITLAKMANIATARFIGRTTAGTGAPEALTGTQATALLDVFASGAKGLAPASGGGTTNFLRADGTWAAPPGGGGGGTPGGSTSHIQFNNSGSFLGVSNFAWDNTNKKLLLAGQSGGGNIIQLTEPVTYSAGGRQSFPFVFAFYPTANGDGTTNNVFKWGTNIDGVTSGQSGLFYSLEPDWVSGGVPYREAHLTYSHPDATQVRLFSATLQQRTPFADTTNTWDFRATLFSFKDLNSNDYFTISKPDNTTGSSPAAQIYGVNPIFYLKDSTVVDNYTYLQQVGPDLGGSAKRNYTFASRTAASTFSISDMLLTGAAVSLTATINWGASGLLIVNPTHASTGVARFQKNGTDCLWIKNDGFSYFSGRVSMPDGINNGDGTYTPGLIFSNNAQKTGIMAATYPISTSAIGGHNGLEFIEGGLRCFSMYWDFASDYSAEKGQASVLRSWASNRLSIESPVSIVHGSGNSRYEWEGTGGGGVLSFIGYDQGSSVGRSFLFGNDTGAGNSVVPVLFQPRENKNAFNIIDTSSAIKGAVTWDAKYGSGISAPTGNFHARKTTGTGGEVGTEILQDATQLTQQYIRHRYDNGTTINDIWYQMSDFNSGEVRDFVKAGGGYYRTFYANGAEALRLQNNGVFSVNRTADDSTGAKIQVGGSISTDAAASTRVAWKFGEAITGTSGLTFNTTAYVKVNINGTLYNLALANLP